MKKLALIIGLLTPVALAQGVRYDQNVTQTATNVPAGASAPVMTVPDALITVCNFPATPAPPAVCTNLASIFSDQAMTQALTNPFKTDHKGRFGFWAAAGNYSYTTQNSGGAVVGQTIVTLGGAGGSGNPNGLGTIQTSTKDGANLLSGGVVNTDASNTANNGASQTQASLCGTNCSMMTPPTSTDTEVGKPLPVLGSKVSSAWNDKRFNSDSNYFTNPVPQANASSFYNVVGPAQIAQTAITGYPHPFPAGYGINEGANQMGSFQATNCTTGYSNGPVERDISPGIMPPLPGYPTANAWAGCSGQWNYFNANGAGIKQMQTFFSNCFGGGDCQTQAIFHQYAGGGMSDSDEGDHAWGSIHATTPGNTVGVVDTVADTGATTGLSKFHINVSVEAKSQGQLRYAEGTPVIHQINADRIIPTVGLSNVPSSVVFNDGTFTPSIARGVVANNDCVVPVQLDGVGIGSNSGTPGCDIAVDVSFGQGHFDARNTVSSPAPMCGSYHTGGLYDIGMVPISTTAISGGHQTVQMSMRRSLPIGSVVYQGGTPGCSYGLDWSSDQVIHRNFNDDPVNGSVFPILGTPDSTTLLVPTYIGSNQTYTQILQSSSHAGTRELSQGNAGPKALGFIALTLTRTSNVVTGKLDVSNLPPQIWAGQVFVTVSGCTQADFNGIKGNPSGNQFKMPGPDIHTIQYSDVGADGTCTNAKLVPQGTLVDIVPLGEILSVSNPATDGSVQSDASVDGTLWTTYQPTLATVGEAITVPTQYAAFGDIISIGSQYAQPMNNPTGISVRLTSASGQAGFGAGNGQALLLANQQAPEDMAGSGGNVFPADAIYLQGPFPFRNFMVSDFAPSPFGTGAIDIGKPYDFYQDKTKYNSSFRTYPFLCTAGSNLQRCTNSFWVDMDADTYGMRFQDSPINQITFGGPLTEFSIPTAFTSAQFETNMGGGDAGKYIPTTAISECTSFPTAATPGPQSCYHRVTTSLGSAVSANPGIPGTFFGVYVGIGQDEDGLFSTSQYGNPKQPNPVTPTNSVAITCLDLPAGKTMTIYFATNGPPTAGLLPVGTCTAPTDVITDTGTYGSIVGLRPWIAGKRFNSGSFAGNAYYFMTADQFGTSGDPSVTTASITQTAPGTLTVNGATKNDAQGSLVVKNLTVSGACTGCGGGGGSGFPITLGSTSIAGSSTTTAVNGLTVNSVTLNAAGSSTLFLNQAGGYTAPTGGTGLSGMTSGQVAIAASATTVTTSKAIAGGGAGLTSGPTTSTTGDIATFTGTAGQIADSGVLLTGLAPKASPTFTGTVVLPAGQVVNGVTLNAAGSSTLFLNQAGGYTSPSGSGNTTSTSLTTNALPKANGANSIVNSSVSDNGTAVSTTEPFSAPSITATTSIGVGSTPPTACGSATGCEAFTEAGTAGTPTATMDYFRADSTSHGYKISLNGGAEFLSLMNFASIALGSQVTGTLPNANITNPSTTVNGQTCTLGATCTVTAQTAYIASGSTALHTAAIASGACDNTTATATGAATTNRMTWLANADLSAVTGYVPSTAGGLAIQGFITANTANFKVCNWSAASITPGAVTIVWGVQP